MTNKEKLNKLQAEIDALKAEEHNRTAEADC